MGLALVLLLAVLEGCARSGEPEAASDPLEILGYRVTSGAASGYMADPVCRTCHSSLWDSYQRVGMSRSFYRVRPEELVEDLEGDSFFHAPSQSYFEMRRRDDRLVFRRYQRDAGGEPINAFEVAVDWILGSGNHVRSYLYQTELGELYELPINWYSRTGEWGMAPGFEGADHPGVHRLVSRECMFCHNGYPEAPAGTDLTMGAQLFPDELPEGTGCQRCHGPGAEHVRAALDKRQNVQAVRAAIVNPGKLDPQLRNDVCYQCHMQPSVLVRSVVRFGRGVYSFRPGQSLAEYKVAVDPVIEGEEPSQRFEINHHPYRLEQSACFRKSAGKLNCLTCHDPHRKVPAAERVAHYRTACAGCHELDAPGFRRAHAPAVAQPAESDCAACHMPERRTQDVVQVTMTDHYIRREPGGPELVAPIEKEADPKFVGVELLEPQRAPGALLATVYRAVSTLRTDVTEAAVLFLERALPEAGIAEIDPWLDLAGGQLALGRLAQAERTLQRILAEWPDHPLALESFGKLRLLSSDPSGAVEYLRRAIERDPWRPATHFDLGLALLRTDPEVALACFDEAIALRPNYTDALHHRGLVLQVLGRLEDAESSYRRALEVDPGYTRSYVSIAAVLDELGHPEEALRFLRHGSNAATDPGAVREVLRERGLGR